jgi:hypothetical protein
MTNREQKDWKGIKVVLTVVEVLLGLDIFPLLSLVGDAGRGDAELRDAEAVVAFRGGGRR